MAPCERLAEVRIYRRDNGAYFARVRLGDGFLPVESVLFDDGYCTLAALLADVAQGVALHCAANAAIAEVLR